MANIWIGVEKEGKHKGELTLFVRGESEGFLEDAVEKQDQLFFQFQVFFLARFLQPEGPSPSSIC